MAELSPRWGYHATEAAKIFQLPLDADLPKGWYDSPAHVPAVSTKKTARKTAKKPAK